MKYAQIGRSALQVSQIGFGCMSLSNTGAAEATEMIKTAIDAGINYFDTADLYDKGANEQLIGELLKPVRKKILLATKVGNQWRQDGSGWNWNPRKDYILSAVDESLHRLQTDYIDLYQLHGGTIEDNIDETIEAFELLVQQGKIRYYGISSIRPNVIRRYVEKSNIQSVMMQYSLLDRRPEEQMLNYLKKSGVSVLARGVLAQGILIDKPAKSYLGYTPEEVSLLQQQMEKLPGSNTALALQYTLSKQAVSSAIIGFRTLQQLNESITAVQEQESIESVNLLGQLLEAKIYQEHR